MKKICTKCGTEKDCLEFGPDNRTQNGKQACCRECGNKYRKKYYQKHREEIKEWLRQYRRGKEYKRKHKKYLQTNKRRIQKYRKEYALKNKEKRNCYLRERRTKDVGFRLNSYLSRDISEALKENKNGRHWESLVNFTLQDLIQHLEKKFTPQMSWQNYGSYWHIDHYIPQSWFIYENPKDIGFKMCWDLDNLQPLEKSKNLSKSNCYVG